MSIKIQKAIPMRQKIDPEQMNTKFKEIGKLYEKQFMREMVKAMRSTTGKDSLIPVSQGERIFREQLDHEYVEKWGDQGGLGLSETIYKNLLDKYGESLGITQKEAIKGPITFDKGLQTKALEKYKK